MPKITSIPGFEGLYLAYDNGDIISMINYRNNKRNVLKPFLMPSGYLQVTLRKNNKSYKRYVHRLIALSFINNHENKRAVNHKDGNKQNNCFYNLEWVTDSENTIHAFANGLLKTKSINQYSLNNIFIKTWASLKDAADYLGVGHSNISSCCNGRIKNAYGFLWKFNNN